MRADVISEGGALEEVATFGPVVTLKLQQQPVSGIFIAQYAQTYTLLKRVSAQTAGDLLRGAVCEVILLKFERGHSAPS